MQLNYRHAYEELIRLGFTRDRSAEILRMAQANSKSVATVAGHTHEVQASKATALNYVYSITAV